MDQERKEERKKEGIIRSRVGREKKVELKSIDNQAKKKRHHNQKHQNI